METNRDALSPPYLFKSFYDNIENKKMYDIPYDEFLYANDVEYTYVNFDPMLVECDILNSKSSALSNELAKNMIKE